MIEMDDSDLAQVMLEVTFTDRTEEWGPYAAVLADDFMQALKANPPDGYVSCRVQEEGAE